MSDNTTLAGGSGGDTIRTLDRLAKGVKTEGMQIDAAGKDYNAESLVSANNPLPVQSVYDLMTVSLTLAQAQLLAQPQAGFIGTELPSFLGAL